MTACASHLPAPWVSARQSASTGGVPQQWYTRPMATTNPRVQVTVDPELGEALDGVEPRPASKSRLIRDLALRGAEAAEEERERREAAKETLLKIARGEIPYDFEASREIHAERERSVALPEK